MTRAEKPRRCPDCRTLDGRWTLSRERCDDCIQSWDPEADGGAAFRVGEDYMRADGLEQTDRRLDRELEERRARDMRDVERLDRVLLPAIKAHGARVDGLEFQLTSELALFVWNEARRLGGQAEVQVWPAERPRASAARYPFSSVGAALTFRAQEIIFGRGSMTMEDGEDADADGKPRRKRRRGQALTAWERAQHGLVRAKVLGRPLPPAPNGKPYGGFLPIEFMPARQSSNGNTGSCRGADRVLMALDVDRAIARAAAGNAKADRPGFDGADFRLLFDMRVGELRRHTGERCWCGGRCFHGSEGYRTACRTWTEMVPLRAAQVAERVGLTPKRVGDRVAVVEREIASELHARDLMPRPRERRGRDDLGRDTIAAADPIPVLGIEAA